MPKILNISNIFFTLPYFFGNQLSHFTNKGYDIHLMCSPSPRLKPFANNHGCKNKEILFTRNFSIASDIKSLTGIIKYIKANHFDIVSGHTPKAGMLAMFAAKLCGVKKRIYFRHGLVYETATGIKRKILLMCERLASACATNVVCVSPYLMERSRTDKISNPHKLCILNIGSCTGIDTQNLFNPDNVDQRAIDDLKHRYNLYPDNFVIGFVGRLVGDKGIVELVTAFTQLYNKNNHLRLLLVGPLEERDAVPENIIIKIKEHPGIIHVGLIESGMPEYYSLMDLFVLPTHREGLGVALLEAQSMRIPVLTTSHTGARDALKAGVTGDYIDMTPKSIVNAITEYLEQPDLNRRQGIEGRKFVIENFAEENIWKEIEKLYLQ